MIDDGLFLAWVDALESGDYQQGSAKLKSPDGATHCVLGVLGEVASNRQVGGVGKWRKQEYEIPHWEIGGDVTFTRCTRHVWQTPRGECFVGQVGTELLDRVGLNQIWERARDILITSDPNRYVNEARQYGPFSRIENFNDVGYTFTEIARALRMAWAEDQERKLEAARLINATQPGDAVALVPA